MSVASFSVRQAVLVNLLFFVCMLAGWIAYQRTPVDFFPDISFNTSIITTAWTGASPREVEQLVTTKIEEEIDDIDGIKAMRSNSRAGVSSIAVEWDETLSDGDYQSSLSNLRAAIDRVNDLPEDAEEPILRELSVGEVFSSVLIAVTDVGGVGEKALLEATDEVRRRMEKIEGVRKMTVRGEHEREVRVLVDRDAAARRGLTVSEIANAIRGTNLNLPAGSFSGAQGETTLRATGNFNTLEAILDTVIARDPDGSLVRLAEVAEIEDGFEKRRFRGRYNGQPALILGVAKDNDSDLIEVASRVNAWLEQSSSFLPEGIGVFKTFDASRYVAGRMSVLRDNLFTGVFLVMAILWFTIGFRNAALTIIAIPFSFLFAMILFPLLGVTINSLSLIGMLLVSGMLVDDAIIVIENIYRRIESGEELHQAVVNGTEEVMWPVIAAVATTAAAFAPLLLIAGTSGEYFSIMPKAVILCLAASLFECLLILPAHYIDFGSRRRPGEPPAIPSDAGFFRRFATGIARSAARLQVRVDRGIGRVRGWYLNALGVVLEHKGAFVALAVSAWIMSCGAGAHLPVSLFPSDFDNFFVAIESPTNFGLEQTDRISRQIELAVLDANIGGIAQNYSTYVGSTMEGNHSQRSSTNVAMSYVTMTDTLANRLHPERALADIRAQLEAYREKHPEGIVDLRVPTPRSGPPVGRPVAARIQGDDYGRSKAIALEMQAFLRSLPGVYNIEDSYQDGPRELRLVLDEERAHQHGLSFRDLALALRAANDGMIASSFREEGSDQERDIRVVLSEADRLEAADILRTQVRTPGGYLVRLGDVARVEITRSPLSLAHFDGVRTITVYADVDGDQATSISANNALSVAFADLAQRHPEVTVVYGGEFQGTSKAFRDMLAALPIALLLVYMILAAVFRSYLQPLVVITAIPFGITGIVVGLHLLETLIGGYSVTMYLLYASVGLVGVMVNDSLVMVDFINRARRRGVPLLEAVKVSGAERLRPILLTTMTTVLALMPMALGLAGASKTYGPFAAGISFGLLVGMLGTLFCVPLFYTVLILSLERLSALFARRRPGPDGDLAAQPVTR